MKLLRYMERIGITDSEARATPNALIEQAFVIWFYDSVRAKLEAEQQA